MRSVGDVQLGVTARQLLVMYIAYAVQLYAAHLYAVHLYAVQLGVSARQLLVRVRARARASRRDSSW